MRSYISVIIALALAIGYLLNIYKALGCDFEPNYKCEVVRTVGIITGPIGGVIGWLSIEES